MRAFVPIVHAVAAVFAIIVMGLMSYIVSPFNHSWTPSSLSFMLFTSIWTLLVLAYIALSPIYLASIFHAIVALILEWITMIFWFGGSIALAVYWGAPSCGGDTYCGSAEAAIAFGFFLWVLFAFLVVLNSIEFVRGRGGDTSTGPKPYVGA
ncbi:hypothetical protein BT67DRAFT_399551 [Trichocladium antarcticum]|uniref:MARVEL domain-containing protein n=1 Tax=Trichocladium antarcticum TaxID=1450529 RepID=A0AAN6UP26_9PEZI|nr:hypothetical protein BT67DRAFT_399551 [Trichocladium antarcticum]